MAIHSAICLAGPTASGKTGLAIRLRERLPLEIISVDSALVYRGMDIGTAKPDAKTLEIAPHRLIDIREPEDSYSAGEFVRDALTEIREIRESGRVPLLVGGTMMYFRSLTEGIAKLPGADPVIRTELDEQAAAVGWPAMHEKLSIIDPVAAARIDPNDSQRIQRALEVFAISAVPISEWQSAGRRPEDSYLRVSLVPGSRAVLHERIASRLQRMIEDGFVEEVDRLRQRPGLSSRSPSMRAVGYRQIWSHLDGNCDLSSAASRALAATRQLAKRQLTWLRADWREHPFDPLEHASFDAILSLLDRHLN
ncbi:MAG: tRNA (adenosine(37)-N6)-dimethylallyltransferase MiaA [Gammaproteobacteria bacterium]